MLLTHGVVPIICVDLYISVCYVYINIWYTAGLPVYNMGVPSKFRMSTRSRIGLQLEDGSVLSAYHHWDGYPQGLGKKLVKSFNTKELASELIDGGDMSSCCSTHDWNMKECEEHVQYYSLRGEDCPPTLHESVEDFINYQTDGDYAYLFHDGKWHAWETENWNSYEGKSGTVTPNVQTPVTIPA